MAEHTLLAPPPSRRAPVRDVAIAHLQGPTRTREMAGQRTNSSMQGFEAILYKAAAFTAHRAGRVRQLLGVSVSAALRCTAHCK